MIAEALDDLCRELLLPHHCYYDSLEELLLYNTLQCLAASAGVRVPPSLSMASVNELVHMAERVLPVEHMQRFNEYARELARHMPSTAPINFPPMIGLAHDDMPEAEHAAALYLQHGKGSLWTAVRHVITLLPFKGCAASAPGPTTVTVLGRCLRAPKLLRTLPAHQTVWLCLEAYKYVHLQPASRAPLDHRSYHGGQCGGLAYGQAECALL